MKKPEPRNDKAIEFLKLLYPDGPWVLTSINVDRKGVTTQTFFPDQLKSLENWLTEFNGKRNIYWHVNPVSRPVTKKAEREDIKEVCYLHVDIDPRVGEDLHEEQKRAIGLLKDKRPGGTPLPTVIVYSGGGIQAFWKLEEPIPINNDLGRAEDAKRYNIQLELLFGADNCHNIDRLCRLPGTLNLPDAKKKKKGRTVQLAELLEFEADRVYPVSMFKPAQTVQIKEEIGFGGESVKVSDNVRRIESVEELNEWGVPDRVKVIIVQGKHPDEPKDGDDSRSAWLFDAICNLLRCEVPDEVIFSIVTDPDLRISESVLDKGSNARKYAIRQIERAKEEAIDPWLRKLNEKHAVIGNIGGKCRVIEEVMDYSLNRSRVTLQSFDDIRNRYMHITIEAGKKSDGSPVYKALGKWWLEHVKRRQFETMTFAPGHEIVGAYNLWKGFACEARPGDCKLFLDHVHKNICQGNEAYYDYLVKWMARTVQKPDSPGQTAIVLRGKQGTGKGFFAKTFGSLFGRHFLQVADPKHLVGSFNAHLRDCIVLFGDEAFYAGDKKHESVLKMLITEEMLAIEAKGIDVEQQPNCTHVILASNSQWVIPAGANERRFFVLDVGTGNEQDTRYFKSIQAQLDSGGREALLYFLSSIKLSDFEVRDVPKTKALHEQKILSMSPDEEWWYRKICNGAILDHQSKWHEEVRKADLLADYVRYMQQIQGPFRRSNETALGKFLIRVCPGLRSTQRWASVRELNEDDQSTRKVKRRVYFYEFPNLERCRSRWEEIYGEETWPSGEIGLELEESEGEIDVPF